MPSARSLIQLWEIVNATIAGGVLAWMVTVYRERRRQGDYLEGATLAIGCGLLAIAAVVGNLYQFHNSLGFRPSMPFATIGSLVILLGARRSIRGLESESRRRSRRRSAE